MERIKVAIAVHSGQVRIHALIVKAPGSEQAACTACGWSGPLAMCDLRLFFPNLDRDAVGYWHVCPRCGERIFEEGGAA